MPKPICIALAAFALFGCRVQSQPPLTTISGQPASTLSLADRSVILSRVLVARLAVDGSFTPAFDGCALRHVLDDRSDFLRLIDQQSRALVQMPSQDACSTSPKYPDLTRRVIVKSVSPAPGGAIVEASFVSNGGSYHYERYTLRGDVTAVEHYWWITEILFFGFVTM